MSGKKVIFMGSKPIGYQCLEYLISKQEELNIDITGILTRTRKEFGAKNDLALLAASINIAVYDTPDEMPDCDIIYSVQYHEILKQKHINKASQVAVNLHMAPLPEYRGSNQFSFALIDGKTEFGTTIHQIRTGIDDGDILFQKRFPIRENCWVNELYALTFDASLKLFKQTISHIVSGNYTPLPQEALVPKYGTNLHFRKEIEQIKIIDLNWEKDKIARHIRATSMSGFEMPYCLINGEKIHFIRDSSNGIER